MNKLSTGSLNQFRNFRISPSSMWISVSLLACAWLLVGCIEQMERPTEGYVEVNPGVEIYFERVGDGPEVVVIPAGMYLREEFAVLASPTRSLLFLDQRGRGRSSQMRQWVQGRRSCRWLIQIKQGAGVAGDEQGILGTRTSAPISASWFGLNAAPHRLIPEKRYRAAREPGFWDFLLTG